MAEEKKKRVSAKEHFNAAVESLNGLLKVNFSSLEIGSLETLLKLCQRLSEKAKKTKVKQRELNLNRAVTNFLESGGTKEELAQFLQN